MNCGVHSVNTIDSPKVGLPEIEPAGGGIRISDLVLADQHAQRIVPLGVVDILKHFSEIHIVCLCIDSRCPAKSRITKHIDLLIFRAGGKCYLGWRPLPEHNIPKLIFRQHMVVNTNVVYDTYKLTQPGSLGVTTYHEGPRRRVHYNRCDQFSVELAIDVCPDNAPVSSLRIGGREEIPGAHLQHCSAARSVGRSGSTCAAPDFELDPVVAVYAHHVATTIWAGGDIPANFVVAKRGTRFGPSRERKFSYNIQTRFVHAAVETIVRTVKLQAAVKVSRHPLRVAVEE
ncbi:hypothetical protein ES703_114884 [subsurface metagenome]